MSCLHMSFLLTTLRPRVMGPPKSGKTNFINQLTGDKGKRAAHQVGSHSEDIRESTVNLSDDRQYVFAEIPGFDDRSDWDILRRIAEWLEKKYCANVKLNGVIYTHCIADKWMSGPVGKNLELFSRFCVGTKLLLVCRW
ncbi:hypothetical protein EDD17DRAFT_1551771, partial [Pisolithus thermaeus]